MCVCVCACAQTAEKRKAMLDDMAMQLTQEKSDHKEALSDLKLQHEKEVRCKQSCCWFLYTLTAGFNLFFTCTLFLFPALFQKGFKSV